MLAEQFSASRRLNAQRRPLSNALRNDDRVCSLLGAFDDFVRLFLG